MSLPARGLVAALNHLLDRASWARERLSPHASRTALLRAAPFEFRFAVLPDGFVGRADGTEPADVTLSASSAALRALVGGDANGAMSGVRIEGNAEFADALGFVFRNLRWDAEEDLSRITGDIVARRVVLAAEAIRAGHVRALDAIAGNLTEYFTEERALLVTRPALDASRDELARLRDDVARLEKRVERVGRSARAGTRSGLPPSN